ncbi:hypothetical protein LUZ62_076135 [Rhynchospora pubera]|uniref:DUF4220 domain-containing protein n=1 Tax=Rhynchospora pubera TaxID=906938 RepID=A0AAV8DCY1_9POAL|nr:hypothetical protein LUZ62_076135 [Rhynchospora pubera]
MGYAWEDLNSFYRPTGSTTEVILVWHIATTLFHHQELIPPQQNNDAFKKNREVALALSTYCYYLVVYLPNLLPDEVEWTEKEVYERLRNQIFIIDRSFTQEPTRKDRCDYAMSSITLDVNSVLGKGVKLAKKLVEFAAPPSDVEGQDGNETQVWTMLSEFWAEMMLFIAPSDNVKGHEEILESEELITQLWALFTHAGILTRTKLTEWNSGNQHPSDGRQNSEITEIVNG